MPVIALAEVGMPVIALAEAGVPVIALAEAGVPVIALAEAGPEGERECDAREWRCAPAGSRISASREARIPNPALSTRPLGSRRAREKFLQPVSRATSSDGG